eukprot:CAMPEP_0177784774 /NCGR_PEP_ID=MMETSP0491_2-20121128/19912_1 /TAXON_ID=63592 /ORGANISM="Tetraselmis chuii, Strain PLY429" /LENGTH=407 /DNA_ID=CAMNT_0019305627 /DNA_START=390 /DNA_END=1609 /DNA_ORIENTATION=+
MSWRKSLATSKNSEKRAFLLALVALIVLYAIFWFRSYSSYAQGIGDSAHSAPPPSGLSRVLRVWAPARYQPMACIGVQTSFNYYAFRRADLRQTWFPADEAAMQRLEEQGIIMRFVVGQTSNAEHELALQQEIEEFGPFLRLPINDTYKTLPWKTHAFVVTAFRLYNPKFVVKVDDDVYLRLDRLRLALTQYEERRFGFIGCMRRGDIESDPRDLNYEPDNAVVGGKEYHTFASGPLYILENSAAKHTFASGPLYILENSAAKMLSGIDPTWLRHLANEDTMMGAWMLSLNVKHFDDRRLCTRQCLSITIGTAPTHVTGRPTVSSYHANCSLSSTLPSGFDNLPLLPPTIKFEALSGRSSSHFLSSRGDVTTAGHDLPGSGGYVASRPRLQYGSAQGAAGGDEPEEA